MQSARFNFLLELRRALIGLAAYFAAVAYGGFALMNGALVSALAAADQGLEWMKPKASGGAGERFHPSLPPKLRGTIEEAGLRG